jgi:hypothetical protein
MSAGWIKLHRKLQGSDMYKALNSKQRDVLIQCLLIANHHSASWEWNGQIFECRPGEFKTSLASLAAKCGSDVKVQSVRTALLKLEKWGFLTNKPTNDGRVISICNWDTYQGADSETNKIINKALTNDQQSSNKALTTNKKDKKDRKDKDVYSVDFEDWWRIYRKGSKASAYKRWKQHQAILPTNLIELTREYLEYCREADRFVKDGEGFLNSRMWTSDWGEQKRELRKATAPSVNEPKPLPEDWKRIALDYIQNKEPHLFKRFEGIDSPNALPVTLRGDIFGK